MRALHAKTKGGAPGRAEPRRGVDRGCSAAAFVVVAGVALLCSFRPAWAATDAHELQLVAAYPTATSAGVAANSPGPPHLVEELPLDIEHGWMITTGRTGPRRLRFLFDTGAGAHALGQSLASDLGLPRVAWTEVRGASDADLAWVVRGPPIHLGSVHIGRGLRAVVDDGVLTGPRGQRYDGLLGTALLARYDALIDVPNGRIRLYRPGRAGPVPGTGAPIPLVEGAGGLIVFRAVADGPTVGQRAEVIVILDTGAPYTIVNGTAAEALGLASTEPEFVLASRGAGKARVPATQAVLGGLTLGEAEFGPMDAVVADLPAFRYLGLADRPVIMLGTPTLQQCAALVSRAREEVSFCRIPVPAGGQSQTAP